MDLSEIIHFVPIFYFTWPLECFNFVLSMSPRISLFSLFEMNAGSNFLGAWVCFYYFTWTWLTRQPERPFGTRCLAEAAAVLQGGQVDLKM